MSQSYVELARRFVAIADAGSLQQAARQLSISQPSLTQSLRNIEDDFGHRLFDRTKRGVLLTPAGARLLEHSRRVLEEITLAEHEIADLADRRPELRLAAGAAWGYCYLPPVIRELQERHPRLRVDLDIEPFAVGFPRLKSGEIDALFGTDMGDPPVGHGMARMHLREIRFAAACGPASPLWSLRSPTLRHLTEQPMVVYQDDAALMDQVIRKIEGLTGNKITIAVQTKSLLASIELVRTGPYVVCLAEPFLTQFATASLRILEFEQHLHRYPTAVLYRKTLEETRHFRALLSLVKPFQDVK